MRAHILRFVVFFLIAAAFKVLAVVSGLFAVALGVFFCATEAGTEKPFTQFPGVWARVRLPFLLRPWDNPFDGLWGDKRGDWARWCQGVGLDYRSRAAMYLWAAIRNPANYFSRYALGVDVGLGRVQKLAGVDTVTEEPGARGWQFLLFSPSEGFLRYRFLLVWAWPFVPSRALLVDLGWKVKLSHNDVTLDAPENDRRKGFVFVLSPWKTLA